MARALSLGKATREELLRIKRKSPSAADRKKYGITGANIADKALEAALLFAQPPSTKERSMATKKKAPAKKKAAKKAAPKKATPPKTVSKAPKTVGKAKQKKALTQAKRYVTQGKYAKAKEALRMARLPYKEVSKAALEKLTKRLAGKSSTPKNTAPKKAAPKTPTQKGKGNNMSKNKDTQPQGGLKKSMSWKEAIAEFAKAALIAGPVAVATHYVGRLLGAQLKIRLKTPEQWAESPTLAAIAPSLASFAFGFFVYYKMMKKYGLKPGDPKIAAAMTGVMGGTGLAAVEMVIQYGMQQKQDSSIREQLTKLGLDLNFTKLNTIQENMFKDEKDQQQGALPPGGEQPGNGGEPAGMGNFRFPVRAGRGGGSSLPRPN